MQKFLLIDTETSNAGNDKNQIVYNISWTVFNESREILNQANYLVPNFFATIDYAYYKNNKNAYLHQLLIGTIEFKEWSAIINELNETLQDTNYVVAYNLMFDLLAIEQTCNLFQMQQREQVNLRIPANVSKLCLWALFCNTFGTTEEYIKWTIENKFLTPSKIPQTKAETAYRYLTGDTGFQEKHLAFEDTIIEKVILTKILEKFSLPQESNLQAFPFKIVAKRQKELNL